MASIDEISKLLDSKINLQTAEIKSTFKAEMKTIKDEMYNYFNKKIDETNERMESLEKKLADKDEEIAAIKKDFELNKRKNNLVFFRIQESESYEQELLSKMVDTIRKHADPNFSPGDIDKVYRIGKKNEGKTRPILVSFTRSSKLSTV